MIAALDTAGARASFALANSAGEPVAVDHEIALGRRSAGLLDRVLAILGDGGHELDDVTQWSIGMGPGSFTGIRVGAAMVKGICQGTGAAYRGLPSSLGMVIAAGGGDGEQVLALSDGRRGQVLVSPYRWRDGAAFPDGEASVMELPALADSAATQLVVLATDPVAEAIPDIVGDRACILPNADATQLLAPLNWGWPDAIDREASTDPIYVRPPVFVPPTPARIQVATC